ncbi:MAG: hypothetical protein GC189_02030 [Alphaproteobacteria bacterium]|nr:hypothetical protein [Alphaproteobacteria bacterium]
MTDAEQTPPRRRRRWIAIGAVSALGAAALAVGPGAAPLADLLLDGQKVWRLGRLDVSGVRGAWIGDLRADTATLRDADGVWARAEGVSFSWSPQALFLGRVQIGDARIETLDVLRSPALSAPTAPGALRFDADVENVQAARIRVHEAAFGRAAELDLTLLVRVHDGDLRRLDIAMTRVDADTDRFNLHFDADAEQTLDARAHGDAGGLFAAILAAPDDAAVDATASLAGTQETGAGALRATIGETALINGSLTWDANAWRAEGQANLTATDQLASLAARAGAQWRIEARGARGDDDAAFSATARSERITISAAGQMDPRGRVVTPLQVSAETRDLRALTGYADGAARIEGALQVAEGRTRFDGALRASGLHAIDGVIGLAGPVNLRLTPTQIDAEFSLTADAAQAGSRAHALFDAAVASAALRYDRAAQRLHIRNGSVVGPSLSADIEGQAARNGGAIGGAWRVSRLAALQPDVSGGASGRWAVTSADGARWVVTAGGRGERVAAAGPLGELLGAQPRIDFEGTASDGRFMIERAIAQSERLRIGARGPLRDGRADLALEASVRGPVAIGAVEFTGVADATGRIRGPLAQPQVTTEARFSRLDLGSVAITAPTLVASYDFATRRGDTRLRGAALGRDIEAQAQVAYRNSVFYLNDLEASGEGLSARGDLAISSYGVSGVLSAQADLTSEDQNLAGVVNANVTFDAQPNTPTQIRADADLRQARFGVLRFARIEAHASGPLDNIAFTAEARGAVGAFPLSLTAAGRAAQDDGALVTTVGVEGLVNGARLGTRVPARIELSSRGLEATASLYSGDGRAELLWRDQRDRFLVTAQLQDAALAPLAGLAGVRAQGTATGALAIRSAGQGLTGEMNVATQGFRAPARMRETIDLQIDAALSANRLTGTLDARSNSGLDAHMELNAPVLTSSRPVRIALSPVGSGAASWRVGGPASALWGLVGGLDQSLEGQLRGEGAIAFSTQRLTGRGELALSDGRFEDKRAGLELRNVAANVRFTEDGSSRFDLSATDANGGRLTGSGAASSAASGRMTFTLTDMRILNRAEASAVASGPMTFDWSPTGAALSGALAISRAELRLRPSPTANIPQLDVIEINRPDGDLPPAPERSGPPVGEARLNLALTAPARVYTRGRGLNAEWSLDMRVRGDVAEPNLIGDARLVRGDFELAGRRFTLTDGRIVFDGAPDQTRLNVTAEREADGFTAIATLSGSLNNPELALSSQPALPEDEILPQVLFGRNAEDLSPFEAAQLASSVAALTGESAFDIAALARQAIGLDRLQVSEDADGVAISGGRYLTNDVYLELGRTSLGQAQTRVEWRVQPKLSIITSFLPNGDGRASIRWRRDY